ncbi:hypothetical protein [Elizabethkingia anophelis]|uniref:hypothetical protein n=1 Tax=Elizabethkingia anophelis TaxID=1117645 RepID=UPI00389153F9
MLFHTAPRKYTEVVSGETTKATLLGGFFVFNSTYSILIILLKVLDQVQNLGTKQKVWLI